MSFEIGAISDYSFRLNKLAPYTGSFFLCYHKLRSFLFKISCFRRLTVSAFALPRCCGSLR